MGDNAKSIWSDEQNVEKLKALYAEGLPGSQIAKQLGGVTRHAVIGKVHRLGLSGRATPSQPARPVFKAPRPPRPVHAPAPRRVEAHAPQPPTPVYYVEEPGSATVLTLGAHMCKWPIGDPQSPTFRFCQDRAEVGCSYCSSHRERAYVPAKSDARGLARSLRRYA